MAFQAFSAISSAKATKNAHPCRKTPAARHGLTGQTIKNHARHNY
jgi:hypothetical protein